MSLNIAVDGDNSSRAFAGATAGGGVSLGGVRGCENSNGGGSPNGWSGKSVPPSSQAVTSLPSSAVVGPTNVSVTSATGQLPNSSLGSWNMNPPPANSSNNSHFANTSIQSQQQSQTQQQQQQQQQANVSNGPSAMATATPTLTSGDIIVDSQDNEAWPSITSMTSTTTTTTTGNSSQVSVSKLNANNLSMTSATTTVSSGQFAGGGTSGVLMLHPPSGATESNSTLAASDVWGTSSTSTAGSAWGGPFAQPPTVTSSSSLASLWGGSTSAVGAINDPNYSPWGTANSVMPQNGSSLWTSNSGGNAASPNTEPTGNANEWNTQLPSQNQQQQPPQQQQQQGQPQPLTSQSSQNPPVSQPHLQRPQTQQQSQQPTQLSQPQQQQQSQQPTARPPASMPPPQTPSTSADQAQQQPQLAIQQAPPLTQPAQQSQQQMPTQAQSPTWGSGSGPPSSAGWLPSAAPSSRATPTNEVAAINAGQSGGSSDDPNRTWAQAAGKGVSATTTPIPESTSSGMKSPEDLIRDETERQVWALINSNELWGKRPVNQGTPWDCGLTKEDHMKHIESNVWMNEPPNGTGQWEHHYESLGEKTARWSVLNKSGSNASGGTAGSSLPAPGVDMRPPGAAHQWGRSTSVTAEGGDGPFWNTQTQSWERGQRNAPPSRLHSVSGLPSGATWNAEEWASTAVSHRSSVGEAQDWNRGGSEQWMGSSGATTPTNPGGPGGMRWNQQSGPDDNSNMWSNMSSQGGSVRGSVHGDDFRGRMMSNNSGGNRSGMRAHVLRRLMDMGFRKEDAQQALISHNMNFERAVQELQNKRMGMRIADQGISGSGDGNFVPQQANSSMLSRNQPMPPPMSMHNPQHAQPMSMQQGQQAMQQVHQQPQQQQAQQQQPQHSIQQQPQSQQQPQQQQQQQQQPHHHQQQQLMRQQIMTQVQASVQNKMQGNGNNAGGSGVQQPNGNGGHSGGFSNSNALFQLQQQIQQIRQQLPILHSRSKSLQTQYLQYQSSGNVTAARNIQQQLEQTTNELTSLSKNHQILTMRLAQLQTSPQQSSQQQNQYQQQQQQQQNAPNSQPHLGSNMMGQQQMNQDHRQYMNQMNDMIERMGNMMPPSNGMTGNHATAAGVWKSSDQNASAPWFNLPTDDQQRSPHGPGQGNLSAAPQVSNLSMDIPEFIPGKPWQGITPKDDPNMTVGSRKVIFNMLNNDHLEKLSVKDSRGPQSPGNPYGSGHRRHHGVYNGPSSMYPQYGSHWILIRNMPSNVTLDLIKMIVGQHGPVVTIQPNLNAGWVLIRFANPEDAMKAQKSLMNNHFGQVESVSESEARALQQEIQALAARFNPNTAWSNTNHFGAGDALLSEAHMIPSDI